MSAIIMAEGVPVIGVAWWEIGILRHVSCRFIRVVVMMLRRLRLAALLYVFICRMNLCVLFYVHILSKMCGQPDNSLQARYHLKGE